MEIEKDPKERDDHDLDEKHQDQVEAGLGEKQRAAIKRRQQQRIEAMIFTLGVEKLGKTQSAGEKERQPKQRRRHFNDLVRREIEGKMKDKQQQRAEKKHRQQALAPAQLQQEIFPEQQISFFEQRHGSPCGRNSPKARSKLGQGWRLVSS